MSVKQGQQHGPEHTQRQLEGIQLDGTSTDKTSTDKTSGKDTKRPKVEELFRLSRDGYTLFVHSMERLARNLDAPAGHALISRQAVWVQPLKTTTGQACSKVHCLWTGCPWAAFL